jgi:hypothetical protein
MDHHLSRYMFKLKSRPSGGAPAAAPMPQIDAETGPAVNLTPLEDIPGEAPEGAQPDAVEPQSPEGADPVTPQANDGAVEDEDDASGGQR